MFTSQYDEQQKVLTCHFTGQLDTRVSFDLSTEVSNAITLVKGNDNQNDKGAFDIVFNLKEVTYISSSFIRICVSAARHIEAGRFRIVNANPDIVNTFKLVGLGGYVVA